MEVNVIDVLVGDFLTDGEDESAGEVNIVELEQGEFVEVFDDEFGHGFTLAFLGNESYLLLRFPFFENQRQPSFAVLFFAF